MTIVLNWSVMICCFRSINLNAVWSHNAHIWTWTKIHSSQWAKFKPCSSQIRPAWPLAVLRSFEAFCIGSMSFYWQSRVLSDSNSHINNHTNSCLSEYQKHIHIRIVGLQHCHLYALFQNLKLRLNTSFGCIVRS